MTPFSGGSAVSRNSAPGPGFRRLIHKDDVDMDQLKEYRVEERYAGSGDLSHFLGVEGIREAWHYRPKFKTITPA